MKTSPWIPNNTIKAREELEYMLEKEDLKVKEKSSIKIWASLKTLVSLLRLLEVPIYLRQINPSSIFSSFLALFRKKSS
jgi:hypothetical protein